MKTTVIVLFLTLAATTLANLDCGGKKVDIPNQWLDMVDGCNDKVRDQIKREVNAAMQYLSMAAHFSRDQINRPGFAKLFFDAASEERQHAIKLMSYLLTRGRLDSSISNVFNDVLFSPNKTVWNTGVEALEDALILEASVTKNIRDVIIGCENPPNPQDHGFNDYHLVDYLTGDFLTEQYRGQRDLAGKVSTLGKMMKKHGPLGEFLFDKKLLHDEL